MTNFNAKIIDISNFYSCVQIFFVNCDLCTQ